jgi:hypothetical protein
LRRFAAGSKGIVQNDFGLRKLAFALGRQACLPDTFPGSKLLEPKRRQAARTLYLTMGSPAKILEKSFGVAKRQDTWPPYLRSGFTAGSKEIFRQDQPENLFMEEISQATKWRRVIARR